MALTQYCSENEVRAALGLSDVELPDAVLGLQVYATGLRQELSRVSGSLPAAFLAVSAKAVDQRSPAESEFFEDTQAFCVYAVARQVGAASGMLAAKDINDEKSGFGRFSDSPYRDTLSRIEALYLSTRGALVTSFAALSSTTAASAVTPATTFLASTRSYDPITGE